jgi:hypothetical protein
MNHTPVKTQKPLSCAGCAIGGVVSSPIFLVHPNPRGNIAYFGFAPSSVCKGNYLVRRSQGKNANMQVGSPVRNRNRERSVSRRRLT